MNLRPSHRIPMQEEYDDDSDLSFKLRAASALGVSVIADALDYAGAPIFALPIIGDIADLFVAGLLYRLTHSKVSVVINSIEFIPFIGDFIPAYTISTLLWILNESRNRTRKKHNKTYKRSLMKGLMVHQSSDENISSKRDDDLRTRLMRAYAVLRSQNNGM